LTELLSPTGTPPWLAEALKVLLGRRGHAWLLSGAKGLGQFDLAGALAASWLCEQEQPAQDSDLAPNAVACGVCAACEMVKAYSHPDLLVLLPEALSLDFGFPLDQKTQEELDDKKRKPSRQVKLDAIQRLITFTQRTSSRGKGLVVVIYPSETMNTIAANALLKSLEEPSGDCRFVLATQDSAALLPTIRSRCQNFSLAVPAASLVLPWLVSHGVAADDAPIWLAAAGGQPQTALTFSRSGISPQAWLGLPKNIAGGLSPSQLPSFVTETPAMLASVLQKICHDALCQLQGSVPRFFSPASFSERSDDPNTIQSGVFRLTSWSKSLNDHVRASEHTLKADLMIEAMLAGAKQALQSKL
jgi:DNA polymerase III subunit delta'